jgi:hypothetical protein
MYCWARVAAGETVVPSVTVIGPPLALAAVLSSFLASPGL